MGRGIHKGGRAMTPGREATVRMVPEEEATGKVAELYADIKATKGI